MEGNEAQEASAACRITKSQIKINTTLKVQIFTLIVRIKLPSH